MYRKYDGHAWCKVITTNIKYNIGPSFKKAYCLGYLHYMQDDCEHFMHSASRNEFFGAISAHIFQL
jgi:hypothetical protein